MKIILFTEKDNKDGDFALTPYLYPLNINNSGSKIMGLGIRWGIYSIAIAFGLNLPDDFPSYKHFG